MKILIVGGVVIGTTGAYHPTKTGHSMTVQDRQSGPALETLLCQCRRGVAGLFGSLGWTLATGSCRLLANLSGRTP